MVRVNSHSYPPCHRCDTPDLLRQQDAEKTGRKSGAAGCYGTNRQHADY